MAFANNAHTDIGAILRTARLQAFRVVNFEMVQAYWNIGCLIVEEEQRGKNKAEYGKVLINNLAERFMSAHEKCFTPSNLWCMRKFYQSFPFFKAVRTELSWTHYRSLLKVRNKKARNFYMNEAIKGNWSTRKLNQQIHSMLFEQTTPGKNKDRKKQ